MITNITARVPYSNNGIKEPKNLILIITKAPTLEPYSL